MESVWKEAALGQGSKASRYDGRCAVPASRTATLRRKPGVEFAPWCLSHALHLPHRAPSRGREDRARQEERKHRKDLCETGFPAGNHSHKLCVRREWTPPR